ncbi:tRNA-dihydrouridine synthase 2 [Marasmius tenuissimus]|uniref:tRNA-dihydrouridine synthase 2 n=1 Tax=Marasmius tenuissimus TaxID=585030 RepID=A0ABR2ZVH1_9AGAR
MSRRPLSSSPPPPRSPKRIKLDHLTSESFKDGVVLAPMVRSGALPTRLFSLKHGAKLVWGPETVDKAILHAERVVDPVTGVVSYNGKSRAIWTTHPIEKPYLIYQLGSADPELAVQAAKTVMQDVSGIDLNCGCPKPFSTHAGMGAALLTNPDLLCSILTALREAMPPEITVTAKIRLLPSQEDTLKLVERIVNTGISALTVHCRTRSMREKDPAVITRLKEIVEFVEGMGKGIPVLENGDCLGAADAKRVLDVTGAHSVMIARAAESNPSAFSMTPLTDVHKTLVPAYLRLSKYLGNHWSLTKFCVAQFKGGFTNSNKAEEKRIRDAVVKGRSFDDVAEIAGSWTGEEDFKDIVRAIESRSSATHLPVTAETETEATEGEAEEADAEGEAAFFTPEGTQNPEPPGSGAPRLALDQLPRNIPAMITGEGPLTPTPGGGIIV